MLTPYLDINQRHSRVTEFMNKASASDVKTYDGQLLGGQMMHMEMCAALGFMGGPDYEWPNPNDEQLTHAMQLTRKAVMYWHEDMRELVDVEGNVAAAQLYRVTW